MSKKLFVGSLSWNTDDQGLREAFATHGEITEAVVVSDRDTGRSRGFGFIEMASDAEAQAAIESLDGADYDGQPIKVNEARPQQKRSGGGRSGHDDDGNR